MSAITDHSLQSNNYKVTFCPEGLTDNDICLIKNEQRWSQFEWMMDDSNAEVDHIVSVSARASRKATGTYYVPVPIARQIWNHYRRKGYVHCG